MAIHQEQNPITENIENVIDTFQAGISDAPENGIANMQNINNDSQPGIALCNYALKNITQPPISGTITAVDQVLYTVTLSQPILYGSTIVFGGSLPTGLSAGTIYYTTGNVNIPTATSGTVTSLALTLSPTGFSSQIVLSSGTTGGTFVTSQMYIPKAYTIDNLRRNLSFNYYVIDSQGQVWVNRIAGSTGIGSTTNIFTLLKGNPIGNGASNYAYGNGIQFYQKFLFVFRDSAIDVYDAYGYYATPYTWNTPGSLTFLALPGSQTPHPSKWSSNNSIYYGDTNFLGSIYNNNFTLTATGAISGTSATLTGNFLGTTGVYEVTFSDGEIRQATFTNSNTGVSWTGALTNTTGTSIVFSLNPSFASTVGQNLKSLQLPTDEIVSSLEEPSIDSSPGTYIYIGSSTTHNIYPWNKTTIAVTVANGQILTTAYDAPLIAPEVGCFQMLNINKIVYMLMGQRGNIYYTNGSSIVLFTSLPKYPTGNPYSLFTWGGIMSLNNNLVYGVADTTVLGVAQNNCAGVWSTVLTVSQYGNLIAGATKYKNQPSAGNYNATVLIPVANSLNFYAGWYNSVGQYGGIDYLDTVTPSFYSYSITPATNQGSFIETDIIPIGTAFNGKQVSQISAKLDTPLVSGEKFRICMRSNLTDTYVSVFEQTLSGAIDGKSDNGVPLNIGDSTANPAQGLKWVQFRADLQTISGGSFVRLKEIRFS